MSDYANLGKEKRAQQLAKEHTMGIGILAFLMFLLVAYAAVDPGNYDPINPLLQRGTFIAFDLFLAVVALRKFPWRNALPRWSEPKLAKSDKRNLGVAAFFCALIALLSIGHICAPQNQDLNTCIVIVSAPLMVMGALALSFAVIAGFFKMLQSIEPHQPGAAATSGSFLPPSRPCSACNGSGNVYLWGSDIVPDHRGIYQTVYRYKWRACRVCGGSPICHSELSQLFGSVRPRALRRQTRWSSEPSYVSRGRFKDAR